MRYSGAVRLMYRRHWDRESLLLFGQNERREPPSYVIGKSKGSFASSSYRLTANPARSCQLHVGIMVDCSKRLGDMNISDLSRSHFRTLDTLYVVSSACCVCVGFDFRRGTFLTLRCFLTSTRLCFVYKFTASLATINTIPPTKLRPHCS